MANSKDLPPLPKSAPGTNGHKYKPQHGVILVCSGEEEQQRLYDAFAAIRSSKIKVVVA